MTRKAHNVDRERTEAAGFADPRSYIRHDGHEFLFGRDVGRRREEVYERDGGICNGCHKPASLAWGEMHHRRGGLVGRCTCLHNLEWLCAKCHGQEHVRILRGKNEIPD